MQRIALVLAATLAVPVSSMAFHEGGSSSGSGSPPTAENVRLVSTLRLPPELPMHADVAAYRDLAFVGRWCDYSGTAAAAGVSIVDVSRPEEPRRVGETVAHPNTSSEDVEAIRIGDRDVLAVGLQSCDFSCTEGKRGLELWDVTTPGQPSFLSRFEVGGAFVCGVHEFDLTRTPDGRVLALLAVPFQEFAVPATGDLLIVDITDPQNPTLAGDWGVIDAFGFPFVTANIRGNFGSVFLHSVRASPDGTRAYLSYWDAGVIMLDIRNPAQPVFIGRTEYPLVAQGDAHSTALARGQNILIQADETFAPFHVELRVTSPSALARTYPIAAETTFTPSIAGLPGGNLTGEVVHVGRGCPDAPYGAQVAGKIALIESGSCRLDNKVAWAQRSGAAAAIVYNSGGADGLPNPSGTNPVSFGHPTVLGTTITIPAIVVGRNTGLALRAEAGVFVQAQRHYSWGVLRLFDISDPARPVPLSTFATPNTKDPARFGHEWWSTHNPEVQGNYLFASWYSDGLRVVDISRPRAPREIGHWAGVGLPHDASPILIWGVMPHRDFVLLSDMNNGLHIVKMEPSQ